LPYCNNWYFTDYNLLSSSSHNLKNLIVNFFLRKANYPFTNEDWVPQRAWLVINNRIVLLHILCILAYTRLPAHLVWLLYETVRWFMWECVKGCNKIISKFAYLLWFLLTCPWLYETHFTHNFSFLNSEFILKSIDFLSQTSTWQLWHSCVKTFHWYHLARRKQIPSHYT
jgi:hypothetical protein